MASRLMRVVLACLLIGIVIVGTQFADALARTDDEQIPTSVGNGAGIIRHEPSNPPQKGLDLPSSEPAEPHGTQGEEGATGGRARPDPPVAFNPVIEPQTAGWPRTTSEVTLAGKVDDPPTEDKWIDVDITHQLLTAYQGSTPIKTVLVSTGTILHPTIIGTFYVWAKVPSQTMEGGSHEEGDYYKLPGVPNIMYFYNGFALHGAYWHTNFGHPMSHGCVNMTLDDAAWLYNWSPPGIAVRTHL